jgi:hypothetical protein
MTVHLRNFLMTLNIIKMTLAVCAKKTCNSTRKKGQRRNKSKQSRRSHRREGTGTPAWPAGTRARLPEPVARPSLRPRSFPLHRRRRLHDNEIKSPNKTQSQRRTRFVLELSPPPTSQAPHIRGATEGSRAASPGTRAASSDRGLVLMEKKGTETETKSFGNGSYPAISRVNKRYVRQMS